MWKILLAVTCVACVPNQGQVGRGLEQPGAGANAALAASNSVPRY